jgi:DNA primase
LANARDAVRKADRTIIVEGYLDWLRMIETGLDNVVAISGTALTSDQAKLLSRFCRRVTLLFDADQAGQRATLRGIDVAFNAGLIVDVAVLPSGDDPDSFLVREGPQKLRDLIDRAPGIVEYRVQVARQEAGGRLDFMTRERLVKELVELARLIEDTDRREAFLGEAAGYLEMADDYLRRAVGEPERRVQAKRISGAKTRVTRYNQFLRLLVEDPAYLEAARAAIEPSDFEHPVHRTMYETLLNREAGELVRLSPSELGSSPDEIEAWSRVLAIDIPSTTRDRIFADGLRELGRERRPARIIREEILEAERRGDREAVLELTARLAEALRLGREGKAPQVPGVETDEVQD